MQDTLKTNDRIRLSSTFHTMHAISAEIVPYPAKEAPNELLSEQPKFGIEEIVTNTFTLKCLNTITGIKFILISQGADKIKDQDTVLKMIYTIYSDYVNKNPFQEADQPIKSDIFDEKVMQIFKAWIF